MQTSGKSKMSETNVLLPLQVGCGSQFKLEDTVVSVVLYTHKVGVLKVSPMYQLIISLNIFSLQDL